jgi:hypothetical protein
MGKRCWQRPRRPAELGRFEEWKEGRNERITEKLLAYSLTRSAVQQWTIIVSPIAPWHGEETRKRIWPFGLPYSYSQRIGPRLPSARAELLRLSTFPSVAIFAWQPARHGHAVAVAPLDRGVQRAPLQKRFKRVSEPFDLTPGQA